MAIPARRVLANLRDLGTIFVGQALSRGIMFLVFLGLAHVMVPVQYAYLNVSFGLAGALAQGPTSLDAGFVLLYGRSDVDRRELTYAYRALVTLLVAGGLIVAVGLALVGHQGSEYTRSIAVGVAYAAFATLYANLPTLEQARGAFARMSLLQTSLPAAVLATAALVWWRSPDAPTAYELLLGWTAAAAALSVFGFVRVGGPVRPLHWPRRTVRRLVRSSVWLIVATVAFAVSIRFELFIVAAILSPKETGFYAVAIRYAAVFELFTAAFATLVLQRSGWAAHAPTRDFFKSVRVPAIATLIGGCGIILAAPWVLPLLFGARYAEAIPSAQLLVAAHVPILAATVSAGALYRAERTRGVAVASMVGLAVKLIVAVPSVRRHGIEGAAAAAVVSSTVVALAMAWSARKTADTHGSDR